MKLRNLICMVLILCLMLALPAVANAAEIVDSGSCGDEDSDVEWKLDSKGTLTLSGTGATEDWAYSGYEYDLEPWLDYEEQIKSVVIKEGVTRIGKYAFSSCVNLKTVSFPKSLTSIGNGAFYECESLTSITIPDTVTDLGQAIFGHCVNLTKVKLPKGITAIPNSMFEECYAMTSFVIPNTVTTIRSGAFSGCTHLSDVTIPDSVTVIDARAFESCFALTGIDIPDTVTRIGPEAFYRCDALKEITLPEKLNDLGYGAFSNCTALPTITIPAQIDFLGHTTFFDCTALKTVYFCGDAPDIPNDDTFEHVKAKVYYPEDNETWTSKIMRDYGGDLTWIPMGPPEAPVAKASNNAQTGKVKLTWNKVENGVKYQVYRATSKEGTYKRMMTTENTKYINTSAVAGKTYYYKVKAIAENTDANSAYSAVKTRTCDLPRPEVTIALRSKDGKPRLKWDAVDGAVEYKIYRATSKNGDYTVIKTTTSTSFTNTAAEAGTTYYYRVVAVASRNAANSAKSVVVSIQSK